MAKKKKGRKGRKGRSRSYCAIGHAAPGTATGAGTCRITKAGGIKCKPQKGEASKLRHSLSLAKARVKEGKRRRRAASTRRGGPVQQVLDFFGAQRKAKRRAKLEADLAKLG